MSGTLNSATATRLEKVAVDNGFDREQPRDAVWLAFASTKAPLRLWLTAPDDSVLVVAVSMALVDAALAELGAPVSRLLPVGAVAARAVRTFAELHHLVRRAFHLSRTLPDALLNAFRAATATLPRTTEAERLVIQRVGQTVFRNGLLEYWQGRCAITGLAIPELLRASHIKPWAMCERDAERLDIFNGLLLAPSLDAAFDGGFITVSEQSEVVVSDALSPTERYMLGLVSPLSVKGLTVAHDTYLAFHRASVFRHAAGKSIARS